MVVLRAWEMCLKVESAKMETFIGDKHLACTQHRVKATLVDAPPCTQSSHHHHHHSLHTNARDCISFCSKFQFPQLRNVKII